MAQGVLTGRVLAHGGRHAKTERYRGRHRKPAALLGLGTGARVAATVTCVALLVCLPQSSRPDRTSAVAAHLTAASQAAARHLPDRFRLIWSTRLG